MWTAIQLLQTEPVLNKLSPADSPWPKRSLLPFLGDTLQWLTGTATMKDMWEIKQKINQLKEEQTKQQETLIHIISILNITWYTSKVNRQKLNEVMDALQKVNEDVNTLFNITDILTQCLRHQQIYTYAHTIVAYLRDTPTYMRQFAIQTMDVINAVMTNILSANILPVEDLRNMLRYIKSLLPSIMHMPISLDDTLHFYFYLTTHIFTADDEFLLLINVPIQDRAQQLQMNEISSLPVLHGNISAQYKINNKCIGATYDETQAVMITKQQYSTCLHANGPFCKIDTPFQPLTNPPSCIAALYTKNDQEIGVQCSLSIFHTPLAFTPITITSDLCNLISTPAMQGSAITMICPDKVTSSTLFQQPFHILKLPPACSATSRHFHLPPHYEDHMVMMQMSLERANLNAINISSPHFHIWQHFNSNWTATHMQKLTDMPEVPIAQLYKHMFGQSEPVLPFELKSNRDEEPSLTWKLLTHPGTYVGTISLVLAICIGIFCFKRFWFRPATPRHQTYSPVSSWHAIVDDDV